MAQNDVIIPATLGNLKEVHEGYRHAAANQPLGTGPYDERTERKKYVLFREGWLAYIDELIGASFDEV